MRSAVRWSLQQALPRAVVRRAARRGDLQARLIVDAAVRADPYPTLDALRARGPLVRGSLSWATASHAVVHELLRAQDFRTGATPGLPAPLRRLATWADQTRVRGPLDPPSLLAVEPPEHTRYRALVSRVFTARAVEGLRPRIQEIADGLLDAMAASATAGGIVDLVPAYATLLPLTVIAEVLGVPQQERARVLALGTAAAPSLDLGLGWREHRDVEAALRDFEGWLGAHLARLRSDPGPDLLSSLVTVQDEGRRLTDDELRATAGLLLAAGFETTVNLLGNGTDLLLRHPGQLEDLRADPALWPNAVEEVLRIESPVQVTARVATRDTALAGLGVPAGGLVAALLAGANHDPDVFSDPHRFDVRRANARDHLAFSGGRHFCLGAALARLEGEIGLRALLTRFPGLALAPGARRRPTRVLRGFAALPVTLGDRYPVGASALETTR